MSKTRFSLFALVLFSVMATLAQDKPALIVIDRVNIVDGVGLSPPIRNGAIVVQGSRIQQIGRRGAIKPGPGVTIIDASGKWAVPGLIDAHVHFDQSGGLFTRPDVVDLRKIRTYEDELASTRERLPVTFLRYAASGITSVVDMGGPAWTFEVRDLAEKTPNAPRVAVAGPLISTHAVPELDGKDAPVIRADSPEHARELVRRNAERRPDLTKILFIHNEGDNLDRQTAIVAAAIDESRRLKIRTAVHATKIDAAKAAVAAGADVLVHSIEDRRVDIAVVEAMTSRKTVYIPTLAVLEGYDEVFRGAPKLNDIEQKLGDPQAIQSWNQLSKIPPGGVPRLNLDAVRRIQFTNLQLMESAGVRVAAGSDAGNIGTLHGPALHRELELMAEAGMRPADILLSATRNAAVVMGKEAELGTLERGKLADLVILDADPTASVLNLRKIHRVMKNGVFVDIPPDSFR